MKKVQDRRDDYRTKLARDFATAFIANQLCVTFRTAQNYINDEVGGFWLVLADVVIKSYMDSCDELIKGSEPKLITDLEN